MSNTPKLRFKEFSGDWEKKKLGNIVELSKEKYNPLKNEETYKCVELENLSQETGHLLGYFNSKEQQSIKNKFNKGQVLFGKLRPYLKKYWLADFDGVCSSEIWVLNGKTVLNSFIYRMIQTDKFNFISNISSGSKMPRADWNYMSEFLFFTPSLEEQEKIASFFSLIDKKISFQGEKVEALKDYKKGMMQKIFSRELRFKDDNGKDYPEWEEKKLGDIATIQRGASPRPIANPKWFDENSKIGWVRISDVTSSNIYLENVTQYLSDEGVKKSRLLEEPHLILSIAASVGKPIINKIPVCIHDGFIVFKNLSIDILFGYYFLIMCQDKWQNFKQPGTQFNLNSDLVSNMDIEVPCKEEQNKIAIFINKIDIKLEKEQEKLDSLNEYKKGLLQQLFI